MSEKREAPLLISAILIFKLNLPSACPAARFGIGVFFRVIQESSAGALTRSISRPRVVYSPVTETDLHERRRKRSRRKTRGGEQISPAVAGGDRSRRARR